MSGRSAPIRGDGRVVRVVALELVPAPRRAPDLGPDPVDSGVVAEETAPPGRLRRPGPTLVALSRDSDDAGPEDPGDPDESANATGNHTARDPTPKASASAPTRPTRYAAGPDPVRPRRVTSMARSAPRVGPLIPPRSVSDSTTGMVTPFRNWESS